MWARGRPDRRLPVGQAVALGVLHGPAELLPISSSGHVALVPWLLRWDYDQLDDELRKSFEVAVHAGTAAALLITLHDEVDAAVRGLNLRRLMMIALSFAPPAVVGYALERPIERRLGTPATIAAGLVVGAVAMVWSDRAPQRRRHTEAGALTRCCWASPRRARWSPGSRATARRWRSPGRVVHPRGRQPPLAPRRAAGDRRRDAAQGLAAQAPGAAAPDGAAIRGRRSWPPSPRRSRRRG